MPAVGTTHHLKLGNEYLMVRPNTYQKRPAPTFGARITSGDQDYNNLSIWQHWVQKCWVGGMDADEWIDDAMFDEGVGVDVTAHEEMRLSRRLIPTGSGSTLGGSTNVFGHKFCVYKNILYCLVMTYSTTPSRLYSYTASTGAWVSVAVPSGTEEARSLACFDGKLLLGTEVTGVSKLYTATTPGTWTLVTNPAGVSGRIYAMRQFNGKFYVAYGDQVWRMKDADFPTDVAKTWDGSTVFYKATANSGSNYIVSMETHLGFLYMLSQNGHLHRTDGNNTFDIWSWDGQTAGVSLRSYDGKLYVGTYEYTDTADVGFGVLYQFTGAAVTELKRWGRLGEATTIGNMIVYGRKLYYGASSLFGMRDGFGIAVYDSIEDGHSIWAMQDTVATYPDVTPYIGMNWIVDDLIEFGGKMLCTVRGHGVFSTVNSFRDVRLGLAKFTTSTQGGELESSLYDAGTPGLMKLWAHVTVYASLPSSSTSFTLSYSLDGGTTWTALTTKSGPSPADGKYIFFLDNKRSTRFKYKIVMKTTNEAQSPTIRGIVCAYLPQPEPGWLWNFTVPVSDKWELLDGSLETKSTNALIAYIEGLFRSQSLVTFTDIDGVQWTTTGPGVLIYDLTTVHYDIESPREGDLRVTLIETVEGY